MQNVHNFSAGPAILPKEVIRKAGEAIHNFNDSGLSILEISHRSQGFVDVMDKARYLIKDLLKLGDEYEVLYLQGGASLQFHMVPLNLTNTDDKVAYVNTGVWSTKAIKEAQKLCNVEIVASSEKSNFSSIPQKIEAPKDAAYLHITSNNTIYGTQMHQFPETDCSLICDMSSDFLSREFDATKFDLIYAGAQKNIGPAGTTVVIVKKSLLGKPKRTLPTILDYQTHIKKESMYNTPSVFAVYATMLTLEWLKSNGGLGWIEKINTLKAQTFYEALDRNPLFVGVAEEACRSKMNATFKLKDEKLQPVFEKFCSEAGISGLKGHRLVGGYRASMYNALPLESVNTLTTVMDEFLEKCG